MILTKSDYLRYLDSPKHFWLHKKRKDLRPTISETDQATFDQGYAVEECARKLFEEGVEVKDNFSKGRDQTKKYAESANVIFQATAMPKDLLARADILKKNPATGKWDIYEVKSTTEVQDVHFPDLAFQRIAFERDGYDIGETLLVHINGDYVKHGEIEPEKLFTITNITEQSENFKSIIENDIPKALELLAIDDEEAINKECPSPKTCPCKDHCWPDLPSYSIYDIKRFNGNKLRTIRDTGILKITDVPDDFPLTQIQQNQVMAAKSGTAMIDAQTIGVTLGTLQYPLYFLDYETYSQAIPLFEGTKPYQNICFQYSLHVMKSPTADVEHYEYLHTAQSNPIPQLLDSMLKNIGGTGTIIVWNKSFEMSRNKEMADQYPEYSGQLSAINERVFDLMEIFSKQHYVHPDFKGSYSIKKVLPVLVPELSHSNLETIQDGGVASLHWFKHIYKNSPEKDSTIKNLVEYCKLDTWAMVAIFMELKKLQK